MFADLFHTVFYNPLYNALVALVDTVPFADVGIAVIILTVAVKFVLFPLSMKAVRTQLSMKRIEPEVARIRERYPNREEQARKTMELYRREGVNPLSSFLVILIQLPIIFALYFVFFRGGLPAIDSTLLYSFIPVPTEVNMHFLGLIDVAGRSVLLALFAGVTQFFQAKLAVPPPAPTNGTPTLRDDLAKSFHLQIRYVLPVVVTVIAYTISAAVALYWTTSNLFAIGQELYVRRHIKPRAEGAPVV